ncbi:MAG: MarR family winged helix-turn-helix transcriptional regulator [Acidimicrobiales bacterium]
MIRPLPFDTIDEARRQWGERWPEAATAMATATSVMRAQQLVLSAVDGTLRPFGLTFARYEALVLLSFTSRGELPLGKMGQRLMIHPTSVTNIVDRLVGDALIERAPHPTDRRTTLARITPKGRALVAEATASLNGARFGVGMLGNGEMEELIRLVRAMRLSSGDFGPAATSGRREP